ncbi:MAG: PCRF domain-containing protein, partial [Candidatus Subteraquimicrobiales bacterium]|nr:PCRF domain-containing protein [Candidatus Subteraquimicrobiales bacterium]
MEIEEAMAKPDFWDNLRETRKIISGLADLKEIISGWDEIATECKDLAILDELSREETDEVLNREIGNSLERLKKELEALEIRSWFKEEVDSHDAIVSIHPGAGGTESQDWANMLLRMYLRWAERKNFETEIIDILEGDEAGIKSVTFVV